MSGEVAGAGPPTSFHSLPRVSCCRARGTPAPEAGASPAGSALAYRASLSAAWGSRRGRVQEGDRAGCRPGGSASGESPAPGGRGEGLCSGLRGDRPCHSGRRPSLRSRPGSRAVISSRALREGQSGNPGRRRRWGRAPRGPVSGEPGPAGVHCRPQSARSPPCSRVPALLREARASQGGNMPSRVRGGAGRAGLPGLQPGGRGGDGGCSTGQRHGVRGRQPSQAQAHEKSRRSSPSRSTAPRSASKASATAVRAVPRWPAPPPQSRTPPWPPLQTKALLTFHPSEGGGEGERRDCGQSRAGDPSPRPRGGQGRGPEPLAHLQQEAPGRLGRSQEDAAAGRHPATGGGRRDLIPGLNQVGRTRESSGCR